MTGFRVARGGAQELYGVVPDLTTLGKIVGGGMPVGAFGGRREIMEKLAPLGPVYQAGTLSGNPVAMAAGLATLEAVAPAGFPRSGSRPRPRRLVDGLAGAARAAGVPLAANQVCGMFSLFFNAGPVTNYREVMASDAARFRKFFHAHAGRGRLPRALAVRGRIRFRRARRSGDRGDHRGRGPRVRGDRARSLMRALAWFLAAIFGTLLLAALLAWPVWQFAHAMGPEWPFHRVVSRFWQLLLLAGTAARVAAARPVAAARTGVTACRGPLSCARPALGLARRASRPCCR